VLLARLSAVLLALVGLPPPEASAFSVSDHRALTEAALDGALASGAPLLAKYRSAVLHGATAEDLNLHVKWTGWHHFYSPEGSLDTLVRQGSEARVRALWDEALEAARHGDLERAFDRAGHLMHHLQDMASPPHVVPVNHGPFDRFERYGAQASLKRAPPRQVEPLSGIEAQRALASETLAAVRHESLQAGQGAIPWASFWTEPAEHHPGAFGGYGAETGNAFGQPVVRWRGRNHPVSAEAYATFMDARVAGALAYTRAFLEWASDRFEEAAAAKSASGLRTFHPAPALSLELVGGLVRDPRGSAPVMGLRAALPLPRGLGLSVEATRGAAAPTPDMRPGAWSLSLLSPPLWTGRPGYLLGLDVRATAGVGLFAWDEQRRWGVPAGLRARATFAFPLTVSADVLYQGVAMPGGTWAHGIAFNVGLGVTFGDR
jgi:hypothetical protein